MECIDKRGRVSFLQLRHGAVSWEAVTAIAAVVAIVLTIVSFWFAWQAKNDAASAVQNAQKANEIAQQSLNLSSAWRSRDLQSQLQDLLSELNNLEISASSAHDNSGCSANQVCLGGLAFTEAALSRYETITMHALSIAEQIPEKLDPTVWLGLANSTYVTGRIDKTAELLKRAMNSNDYLVQYRAEMLLAECDFMRHKLEDGKNHVENSLKIIQDARNSIPATEMALRKSRACLTCSALELTWGQRAEALAYLQLAAEAIASLPDIRRRADFYEEIDELLDKYTASEQPEKKRSFDEVLKDAKERAKSKRDGERDKSPRAPAEAGS
jgi:tetratricopeptide (TPR) repeat protein